MNTLLNSKNTIIDSLKRNNPHDHFFKLIFSDSEKVKSFLQGALPADLATKLDYETLKADPNNYIDQQL